MWKIRVQVRDQWCLMHKRGSTDCELPLQGAHIISQHHLKKRGLQAHLWDDRNGMLLCVRHHTRHDNWLERVPREQLPEGITGYCHELGITNLLDRQYPKKEEERNE